MAYRNVFSQMFDVRPCTQLGGLDLERIEKIQRVLDLAQTKAGQEPQLKSEKEYEARRVVDLREKIAKKLLLGNAGKPVQPLSPDEQILKYLIPEKSIEPPSYNPEILENSYPTREEILAQLEEIERINIYLQEHNFIDEETKEQVAEAIDESQDELLNILARVSPADFVEEQQISKVIEEEPEEIAVFRPVLPSEPLAAEVTVSEISELLPADLAEPGSAPENNIFQDEAATEIPEPLIAQERDQKPEVWGFRRSAVAFISAGCLIFLVIFGLSLTGRGLSAKDNILSSGLEAYRAMLVGKESASRLDFSAAQASFSAAYSNFLQADQELDKMGRALIVVLEQLPGGSPVESGSALISAGKDLAQAAQSFSRIGSLVAVQKIGDYFSGSGESLTQKVAQAQGELKIAQAYLVSANNNLNKVNVSDLPSDLAPSVSSLKEKLPAVAAATAELDRWSGVFLQAFGHERVQKYLLIFQNNAEARATGGFIGTYGILDLDQGRIKNLFIDGIFNLDGQLDEKVVPPRPIQKISTAWSTHDANWFPDWPTSAKKIMGFYEAAGGGETVDGVISLTPTVVEQLLALTGPIDVPEFNLALDKDNFSELIQYKVESDYDKELNQPKKILADFTPKFLEKLWEIWPQKYDEIITIASNALAEKQILFYFSDPALQETFVEQGWAGEVLQTDKDYLSVINTNINGFKTDKMIEQKIYHSSQVQSDGSIIDTVKIVRTHTGGKSLYDWYNKVNANYLRVYVPQGSQLLSAQGHTRETYSAPADYQKLNFKTDPDVAAEEQGMTIDSNSGTQIFTESGKTVFGNWVYVSPSKTVEVTYRYLLPFKLNLGADSFSYSLLAQKQAGSIMDSGFESILELPQEFKIGWQYPENLQISGSQIKFSGSLKTDKFYGVVFAR
ncbi:DUF4012 domain-containing protein [Patescibacteria group bacterium]|nr:DUF4012 domain-containing protein [Patescibacteria group bacterium]